jgi:Flp pilus assembly protein TadB
MQVAIRLTIFCSVSAFIAVVFERNGFALVHSSTAAYFLFLVAPGCLLIFLHGTLSPMIVWPIFVVVNVLYYEIIFRVLLWLRKVAEDKRTRE